VGSGESALIARPPAAAHLLSFPRIAPAREKNASSAGKMLDFTHKK
jgi:hypothetical protein